MGVMWGVQGYICSESGGHVWVRKWTVYSIKLHNWNNGEIGNRTTGY